MVRERRESPGNELDGFLDVFFAEFGRFIAKCAFASAFAGGFFERARIFFLLSRLGPTHPSFFRVYRTCPDHFYFYSLSSQPSTGKTDYQARRALIAQDKNKYNTPKYRFVVRFTNRRVICQIVYATIAGDVTVCQADSLELERYGLKAGYTNYPATYATGLLCARRMLTKYNLAETYEGKTDDLGEDYHVEAEGDARPFKCFLDTGLVRTSTGARVFAAMKGASDGGLDIPHNEKRFAGYDLQDKSHDPDTLERYIKGGVVAEYAEEMQEEEPEKFEAHFSKYLAADQDPTELEELYEEIHDAIREDPSFTKKPRSKPADAGKKFKLPKLTYEQKKANLKAKIEALRAEA